MTGAGAVDGDAAGTTGADRCVAGAAVAVAAAVGACRGPAGPTAGTTAAQARVLSAAVVRATARRAFVVMAAGSRRPRPVRQRPLSRSGRGTFRDVPGPRVPEPPTRQRQSVRTLWR